MILMSYSLIIPIFNEEKTLTTLISQIETLNDKIEVIIINDGSDDKTKEILKNYHNFKIINHSKNLGKGSSIISGVQQATKNNIILMDGDLEIHMDDVIKAIEKYEATSNCVIIGSRWNNSKKAELSIITIGNYFINYIFNMLYKTNFNDVLCCIKIMDTKLFKQLKIKSQGFNIEAELMSKLALKNYNILEVLVDYKRRNNRNGKKLKISDGWGIMLEIVKIKFSKN